MDNAELRTRVGVAHLLATYQYLADSGRVQELSELFLPDAVFLNGKVQYNGREGVLGFFNGVAETFRSATVLPARHHLSSVRVDPRPDGSASTYACFQFIGVHGLDHWGTYRDEVVEVDGTWRFARRHARVEGYAPDSPMAGMVLASRAGTGS